MAIQLRAKGLTSGKSGRILGRITHSQKKEALRSNYIRVIPKGVISEGSLTGYAAVLFEGEKIAEAPYLHSYKNLDFLHDDYIVVADLGSGFTHVLYRPESKHNLLFVTERCNSNCLMCSQPPREVDDSGSTAEHLHFIDLIPNTPKHLGISGGEPTLLKSGLIDIVKKLHAQYPDTPVTMLSNGRMYAYEDYVKNLVAVGHSNFLTSIPLHANNATVHDYVAQSKGAFDQTIQGLYNAAKHSLSVELRVVLHKLTIPGLRDLADFIYHNLPFVQRVALMGLEHMGYVKKNFDQLCIDPMDYCDELEATMRYFHYRRIQASIYNLPLCVLPKNVWGYARKSISDFKNIYLEQCQECSVKEHCGGLFESLVTRYSRGIKSIR